MVSAGPRTFPQPHPARAGAPDDGRGSRRRLWIAAAVGIPASVLLSFLAIRGADLGAVWASLAGVRIAPLVGAAFCMGVVYWLQAARWRRIALTRHGQRRFLEMVVAAVAVNNVLPGRVGDLLRARWVSRGAFSYGRGVATVVFDRAFDLLVLAVLLLATLPLVTDEPWVDRIVAATLLAVGAVGLGIGAARSYTRRRPWVRRRSRGVVRRFARDLLDGLSEPLGVVRTKDLVLLSLGAWLVWSAGAFLAARAVGVELTVVQALFVTAAVNLGVAIPSSPGFVGTYQWLGVSAVALFGVGQESGLAFAIVLQAVWYVPTTVAGIVLLASGARSVGGATSLARPARAT